MSTIETPCIGVCSTVYGDDVCRGCRRFADEIIEWNGMSTDRKYEVLGRLAKITETVMRDKIKSIDETLLKAKLEELQIRHNAHDSAYCWVYSLLRAYAFKIDNLADYGVELFDSQKGVKLKELLETIDEELYSLSENTFVKRNSEEN